MKNKVEKFCGFCGKPFLYFRSTARYCSDTCRVKDCTRRKKEIELAIFALKYKQKLDRWYKVHPPQHQVETDKNTQSQIVEP
jgi:hypothetical protein